MRVPIEVVVIREPSPYPVLAVIPRPPPPPPPPPLPPEFSAEQQRELSTLLEALHCDVRRQILLALASAGVPAPREIPPQAGRANVARLSRLTGIDPKKLSSHLGKLKDLGLLFSQRSGKEIWYEVSEGRVRYQRHACGEHPDDGTGTGTGENFDLTLTARAGGVAVTVTVGGL